MLRLAVLLLAATILAASPVTFSAAGGFSSATPSSSYSAPNAPWELIFTIDSNPIVTNFSAGEGFTVNVSEVAYYLDPTISAAAIPLPGAFVHVLKGGGLTFCFNAACTTSFQFQRATLAPSNATADIYGGPESAPTILSGQYLFTGLGFSSSGVQYDEATQQRLDIQGSPGFITSQSLGPLRNDYSGFVGFEFTVGSTPVRVQALGRFVAPGNTGTHLLKLVDANGVDVPNGSVAVSTGGAQEGAYQYASLAAPITLLANTSYFLVSQETAGGDQWYDYGQVVSSGVATVVAPAYQDQSNHYVAVDLLPGRSYGPVNFQYVPPTTTLSVGITSPAAGGTISGNASVYVSTTGPVTSLQVQVDGANQGAPLAVSVNQGPSYTLSLDTTVLSNGTHSLTVVASDAQSKTASSKISVTVNNPPGGSTPFVLGQSPGPLRNNYTGFVGLAFKVGSTPVVVAALGRFVAPGNAGTHLMKLVNSDGSDVPGGSVSVPLAGATPGKYQYATLPAGPFTLQANTTYYLVSQETAGGDQWYDYGPVSTSIIASVLGPTYSNTANQYVTVGGLAGESYVPVSFLYGSTANTVSAVITSPTSGALLSGKNVPVAVSTTGEVNNLQLQLDGFNWGNPASSSPLTLDTTLISNGQHTLSVVVSDANFAHAASPAVSVTVNNGGHPATAFTLLQTPTSTLRNDYTGFVGMTIQVGATPLSVTSLGRYVARGNSGTHTLKLVQANGIDVPGGSVSLSLDGKTPGQYAYATLASPVALLGNTTYYLVSEEGQGGDLWYDLEPITTTGVAQVTGPTYTDGGGNYITVSGFANYSYVPLSFLYQ